MLDKLSLYAHKNKINKRRKTADKICLKHTIKDVVTTLILIEPLFKDCRQPGQDL